MALVCARRGQEEVVMTANTKVSALDHAMHNAHTWVNDVAKEFDTEDREFVYGVLLHYLPPTQMNKALDQLPPEIRALLQPQASTGPTSR
jgi:uncharacterized protein (DUF2267 family)